MDARLKAAAGLVPRCGCVADIGADHALLSIYLVKMGIARRVIAADVKKLPLETGRLNVLEEGVADSVELRLSFGFENFKPGEFDAAVIAGMGGETIAEILQSAPFRLDMPLVLQPMTRCDRLLSFLNAEGFSVKRHIAAPSAGRIYHVLRVERGGTANRDPLFEIVGGLDLTEPNAFKLMDKKLKVLRSTAESLKNIEGKRAEYLHVSELCRLLGERLASVKTQI